jgi:putative membrane-bound dehydrogenase-like protein
MGAMRAHRFFLVLLVTLQGTGVARGQDGPRDLTGDFDVPGGLAVTLWAESPDLYNPTALDVDARGRLWVTEAVNYRKWDGRNPGRDHAAGDRVVVLEDTDGDGRCDRSHVFVQDPELVAPLGIAVIGDEVYVSSSPNLFVYRDTDGDGAADERETLLTGFGGFDHDHGLHSVVAGPGGRLVFNAGNAGPHIVTDAAGWTLRSGSLYRGGGPEVADNKPGLVSDDGRAYTGGLVLRVGRDGAGLEVLAHNFRNNYEVALDAFGNLYQTDNDDDGNASCRTLWCMEGGDHGFFSADGSRTWQADRRPGQTTQVAHWHQDDPGVVPSSAINGAGGPTGIAVYEGALLARWIDGAVLNTDAGANVLYAHRPVADGAGIALETHELLRPKGAVDGREAHLFRPSDVAVGIDGSLFVADWYDPGVGGHLARDREAYGRIVRIAPRAGMPPMTPIDTATVDGALTALASPAVNVRELGRRALVAGGEEARRELHRILHSSDAPRLAARATWILAARGDTEAVVEQLSADDPRLRVTAIRALAAFAPQLTGPRLYSKLADDPHAMVRREVALQLRGHASDESLDVLTALARGYDGADRWYLEALGLAAEGREEPLYVALAAELGDTPRNWDARFANLAWRLHPPAAVSALVARALDATLDADARRQALDALAFSGGRSAAEGVLTAAKGGPDDLREYAAWWVRHRDGNDWRAYDLARRLEDGAFGDAEVIWESGLVRSGLLDVDVDVTGVETLWLVVTDGGNGNSCDWADWIEPRFVGGSERWDCAELDWLSAEAVWGNVRRGRNCVGAPLAVAGVTYADGIGTHADSRVGLAVPAGATRFVARVGPDDGGTSQGGGQTTSITFQLRATRPAEEPPIAAWEARMLDASATEDERVDSALALAVDPRGALLLIRRAAAGELDELLTSVVTDAIHRNPDLGVRALASEHFPRPVTAGGELSLSELGALAGDETRGRGVLLDRERSTCLTCHAFTLGDTTLGGDVGPDLTRIAEKLAPAELLDAIVNPSAGIAFGYDTWLVETADGLLLSGFLLADGETVVLKDTRGERWVLPAESIVARTKQTLSTMPEGVALGLSDQELADLVAFLSADPAAPPEFGEEVVLFDGSSLDGWVTHDGSAPGDVWTIRDGVLRCTGSPVGYLRTKAEFTSYLLTLEWRFDPERGPGNSGVLLRRHGPDEVWPRSIEAQLHHRNAGDIWNIGAFGMHVDPARTSGRRTTRLQPSSEKPLGEWNRYEILLDGPRLELRVNGVLQNTADGCEERPGNVCLQSEGATIEFRDVRLRPILR